MAARTTALLLTSIVLAAPRPAAAQGAAIERSDKLVEKARASYDNMDYELALDTLDRALRLEGSGREQLVQIHYLRAICLGTLGKTAESRGAFAVVLSLRPDFEVEAELSPRVRRPYEELVAEARSGLSTRVTGPELVKAGEPLVLVVEVADDPLGLVRGLRVVYQLDDAGGLAEERFALTGVSQAEVAIALPPGRRASTLTWHAEVLGPNDSRLERHGEPGAPMRVVVEPPVVAAESQTATPAPPIALAARPDGPRSEEVGAAAGQGPADNSGAPVSMTGGAEPSVDEWSLWAGIGAGVAAALTLGLTAWWLYDRFGAEQMDFSVDVATAP